MFGSAQSSHNIDWSRWRFLQKREGIAGSLVSKSETKTTDGSRFGGTELIPTEQELQKFCSEGYFITRPVLDHELLDEVARDFERLRARQDADLGATGERVGISHQGRNFIVDIHAQSDAGRRLALSRELAELAGSLLGPDVRLYWNQAVTKAPKTGGSFSWHQDSGYVPIEPLEYLTLWIPLEDASVANGTIWVIPGSHRWGLQKHLVDEQSGDKVGYQGDAEGVPCELPKGAFAVFSSLCLHRSGPNTSNAPRRAYVVQFSPTRAINPETGQRWGNDIEVVRGGTVIV